MSVQAGSVLTPYGSAQVPAPVIESARRETPSTLRERFASSALAWRANVLAEQALDPSGRTVMTASFSPFGEAAATGQLWMGLMGVMLVGAGLAGRKRRPHYR
jgi:LPXTG-motif cell wall-anchored protein